MCLGSLHLFQAIVFKYLTDSVIKQLKFTGAASGIGRATCQILAREGAVVIGADKNKNGAQATIDEVSKLYKNNHTSLQISVNEHQSVKDALQCVIERYKKPPSVVVNCAGITRDNFLLKLSEQDFNEVIDVNLKVCGRCFLRVYINLSF